MWKEERKKERKKTRKQVTNKESSAWKRERLTARANGRIEISVANNVKRDEITLKSSRRKSKTAQENYTLIDGAS